MNKMPYEIKTKLKQLQKSVAKTSSILAEITDILEKYDLDIDLFTANANLGIDEQTEGLSYILNDESNDVTVEESIKEIERVFLLHVNRKNGEEYKEEDE